MSDAKIASLIQSAAQVRHRAYAPYSRFMVGAAVLSADGQIHCGCNVENASYGLAICAERMAIGQAIANGQQAFSAIAVVASSLATPCGACRQFIVEFGKKIEIVCAAADDLDTVKSWRIEQLLPESFSF